MEAGRDAFFKASELRGLLGGSWVAISGVISRATAVITHIRGLKALPTTTHEPPSRGFGVA